MSDDSVCLRHQRHRQCTAVQRLKAGTRSQVLKLAVNGKADFIITGDTDLLGLGPFRGIEIIKPADLLLRLG